MYKLLAFVRNTWNCLSQTNQWVLLSLVRRRLNCGSVTAVLHCSIGVCVLSVASANFQQPRLFFITTVVFKISLFLLLLLLLLLLFFLGYFSYHFYYFLFQSKPTTLVYGIGTDCLLTQVRRPGPTPTTTMTDYHPDISNAGQIDFIRPLTANAVHTPG